MPSIGDIFLVRIYYRGRSGHSKLRPVLIINFDFESNLFTIAECTTIPPHNPPTHYDQYKVPLENWQSYGLDKETYVKCKNIHRIEESRLIHKLGRVDEDEFIHVVEKIIEFDS